MLDVVMTENGGRGGGFLVDFSAYQGVAVRDGWPVARVSERVPGNQTNVTTRHVPHPQWHNHSENPPPDLYLQCSTGGTSFSGPGIPSGECFTGIADSSCALSLLSNQSWGSRSRASGLRVGDLMQAESKSVAQPVSPHGNQYSNMSWCFKGNEAGSSSHQLLPQLGLRPSSEPINSQFSGELELSQPSTRHYMDLEHSRDYDDSTLEMHWSL